MLTSGADTGTDTDVASAAEVDDEEKIKTMTNDGTVA